MTARNQDFVVKNGLQVTSNLVVGAYTGTSVAQSANGAIISGNVGIGTSIIAPGSQLSVVGGNLDVSTNGYGYVFPDGSFQTTAAKNTPPGGANHTVQYNLNNAFAGNSQFVFDDANIALGIGTAAARARLDVVGNLWISNTASTTSGIYFPDGTFQTTAVTPTPSYGPQYTIQFAGAANAFSGDSANLFWSASNSTLQTNNIVVTSGTAATYQGTGALQVQGGASISGNLFLGGNFTVSGNLNIANVGGIQDLTVNSLTSNTFIRAAGTVYGQSLQSNASITAATYVNANQFIANANVGIGTATVQYPLDLYGNLHIGNTATTSGIVFPDGSFQDTAATNTPSYGTQGTVQFAGAGNTFAGDTSNLYYDTATNTLEVNGGKINLHNSTSNLIDFGVNGVDYPFNSALGDKIYLYNDNVGGIYSIGIDPSPSMYFNIPYTSGYTWYGGGCVSATLNGFGDFYAQTSVTSYSISATNQLGIGTSTPFAWGTQSLGVFGNQLISGNIYITNTLSTTSGLVFPDGSFQNTAPVQVNTSSYGPIGTIQFAGNANTFSGNSSAFFWDNGNVRLGIGTDLPSQTLTLVGNLLAYGNTHVLFGRLGIGTSNIKVGDNLTVVGGNINIASFGTGLYFPDGSFQQSSAGSSAAGPNKSVQFNDGGLFAGVSTFQFDKTNFRLGIGTSNLTNSLMVYSATPALFNTTNGSDQQIIVGNSTTDGAVLGFNSGATTAYGYMNYAGGPTNIVVTKTGTGIGGITIPQNTLDVGGGTAIGYAYAGVQTAPTDSLIVSGKVGIGTYTPGSALDVYTNASVRGQFSVANNAALATVVVNTSITTASFNATGAAQVNSLISNTTIQGIGTATLNEIIANNNITTNTLNARGAAEVNDLVSNTNITSDTVNTKTLARVNALIANNNVFGATLQSSGQATVSSLVSNNNITTATLNATGAALVSSLTSNTTIQSAGTATVNELIANNNVFGATLQSSGQATVSSLVSNNNITTATLNSTGAAQVNSFIANTTIQGAGTATVNALISNNNVFGATLQSSGQATVNSLVGNLNVFGATLQSSGQATVNSLVVNTSITTGTLGITETLSAGNIYSNGFTQTAGLTTTNQLISNANIYGANLNIAGLAQVNSLVSNTTAQIGGTATVNALVSNNNIFGATLNTSGLAQLNSLISNTTAQVGGTATVNELISNNNIFGATLNTSGLAQLNSIVSNNNTTSGTLNITGQALVSSLVSNNNITGATINSIGAAVVSSLTSNTTMQSAGLTTVNQLISNANIYGANLNISGTAWASNVYSNGFTQTAGLTTTNSLISNANIYGANINIAGPAQLNSIVSNTSTTTATLNTTGLATVNQLISNANIYSANLNIAGVAQVNGLFVNAVISTQTITSTGAAIFGSINSNGIIQSAGTTTVNALISNTNIYGATMNINGGALVGSLTSNSTIQSAGNAIFNNFTANTRSYITSGGYDVTGDSLITGNLQITGNLSFAGNSYVINSQSLTIVDPVIELGIGTGGTPLVVDDGYDRGVLMDYFHNPAYPGETAGFNHAFMGYNNSTGRLIYVTNVAPGNINVNNDIENYPGIIYGGATFGNIWLSNANAVSTTTTSGGVVVIGGVGVGGNINVGGQVSNFLGNINVFGSNAATSATTGALTVTGGAGILGSLYVGGNINANNSAQFSFVIASNAVTASSFLSNGAIQAAGALTVASVNSNGTIVGANIYSNGFVQAAGTVTAAAINSNGVIVGSNIYSNGFVQAAGTVTAAAINSNGTIVGSSVTSNGIVQGAGTATFNNIYSNGFVQAAGTATVNALVSNVYGLFGQNVTINSTNASTSSTTGALVVAGGQGLGGNLRVAAATTSLFGGNLGIGTTSSLGATANVMSVYGTANHYGNIKIANTAAGGSGIYFPDGTFLGTAAGAIGGVNESVQFNDNGVFGGTSTFIFDKTNTRLGIGTTTAGLTNSLMVFGATPALFNTTNGGDQQIQVGNTTSDGATLGFNTGATAYGYLKYTGAASSMISFNKTGVGISGVTIPQNPLEVNGTTIIGSSWAGNNSFINPPSNGLAVQGSVGIGTFTPLSTLDVRGVGSFTTAVSTGGTASVSALIANNNVFGATLNTSGLAQLNSLISNNNITTATLNSTGAAVVSNLTSNTTIQGAGTATVNALISNNNVFGATIQSSGQATLNSIVANNNITTATLNSTGAALVSSLTSNTTIQSAGTATVNALISNNNIFGATLNTSGLAQLNSLIANTNTTTATLNTTGLALVNSLIANANIQGANLNITGTAFAGNFYSNGFVQAAGTVTVNALISNNNVFGATLNTSGLAQLNSLIANTNITTATINSTGLAQLNSLIVNANIESANLNVSGTAYAGNFYSNGFVQAVGTVTAAAVNSNGTIVGANIYSNGFVQAAGTVTAAAINSNGTIVGANIYSNGFVQAAGTVTAAAVNSNGTIVGANIYSNGFVQAAGTVTAAAVNSNGAIVGSSITSNGTIQSAGTTTVNALISNVYGLFGQNVTINSTNTSISTTTGALIVTGGTGIAGNLNVGGNITTTGTSGNISGVNTLFATKIGVGTTTSLGMANAFTVYGTGMVYGNVVLQNTSGQSGIYFSDGSYLTTATSSYSNTNVASYLSGPVQIGNLYIINSTSSTSSVTGALITNGGVGISGNLNTASGTTSTFGGNIGIGTASALGATSNVMTVYGTEMLYGNIVLRGTGLSGNVGIFFPDGTYQYTASMGGGGSGTPGGSNTNIQFNNSGTLGGSNGLVFFGNTTQVGIGTSHPNYTLDVYGNIHIGNNATGGSNGIVFADGTIQTTAANAAVQTFSFTATAGQTTFSVFPYNPGPQGVNLTQVFVNGVYQRTSTYAWTGTNIVLTTGAVQYARVEIRITIPATSLTNIGSQIAGSNVFNVQTAGVTVWNTGFSYTVGYLDVYLNGIKLTLGSDYTAGTGTSVTFTASPPVGSIVQMTGWNTNGVQQIQGNNVFNVQTSGITVWNTGFTYTVGYLDVYVNGVKLASGYDYTATTGTSVQFTTAPLKNSLVTFEGWTQGSTLGQLATQRKAFYVASAGQTVFASQGPYVPPYVDVYVNGIKLVYTTDYTATDGSTVVLNSGLVAGSNVEVISSMTFAIGDVVRRTGDIFTGNVGIGTSAASNAFVVVGTSQYYGSSYFYGNINSTSSIATAGSLTLGGNIAVAGTAALSGNLAIGGTLTFADGSVQNTASVNQLQVLNDISTAFDGQTTTFNLSIGSSNINIATPQQLLISVGGAVLAPFITNPDYIDLSEVTLFTRGYKLNSGRIITFANAPRWQQDFSGRILSNTAPVNNTVTYPFKPLNIALADG